MCVSCQYYGDMSNAIVTVVVGFLVEYKANIIGGKSELLPDWAHHATKVREQAATTTTTTTVCSRWA